MSSACAGIRGTNGLEVARHLPALILRIELIFDDDLAFAIGYPEINLILLAIRAMFFQHGYRCQIQPILASNNFQEQFEKP